jgi:hypothetical protein
VRDAVDDEVVLFLAVVADAPDGDELGHDLARAAFVDAFNQGLRERLLTPDQ